MHCFAYSLATLRYHSTVGFFFPFFFFLFLFIKVHGTYSVAVYLLASLGKVGEERMGKKFKNQKDAAASQTEDFRARIAGMMDGGVLSSTLLTVALH